MSVRLGVDFIRRELFCVIESYSTILTNGFHTATANYIHAAGVINEAICPELFCSCRFYAKWQDFLFFSKQKKSFFSFSKYLYYPLDKISMGGGIMSMVGNGAQAVFHQKRKEKLQ